jgi:hypothetical protein
MTECRSLSRLIFFDRWLDKKNTAIEMADFLAADAYSIMQLTPISARVNNPLHNDIECLAVVSR